MSVQLFPALDPATEAALRASIARFGVLVPVVKDQHGRVLDGHHRSRIARELGVSYRGEVVTVADEDEAREIARTLNADRRHLAPDQRRPVVVALREEGHSFRAIGGALGVHETTVMRDVQQAGVAPATRGLPERVQGQDGKSYPARQPKVEREPVRRSGLRDRTRRYEPTTAMQQHRARAQHERIVAGLSEIRGICRGLTADIDYRMAASVCTPAEIDSWSSIAGELATNLRIIKAKLMEVRSDAREAHEDDPD